MVITARENDKAGKGDRECKEHVKILEGDQGALTEKARAE